MHRKHFFTVKYKFVIALTISACWFLFCTFVSIPWVNDLSQVTGQFFALFVIFFIALIPGFMNMFLFVSYLLDHRPNLKFLDKYPSISVLIPTYNEQDNIYDTILSVLKQNYQGDIETIVIDDGSTDKTIEILHECIKDYPNVTIIENPHMGKSYALNTGLAKAKHELIVTVDSDTYLLPDSIDRIVTRFENVPPDTVAVAGSVYAKNSNQSLMTRIQQWDYFFAIEAIKRVQSFLQGTLVAQGAFSLYRKHYLEEIGGWSQTVGEDIVLTWALLKKGYRIVHGVDAIAFTNLPVTYKSFFLQRSRWARGMLEAFRKHPQILLTRRLSTFFIYWNILFPIMDLVYLFVFVPGIIAALFGHFYIAGPMTLAVFPLIFLYNSAFFYKQKRLFKTHKLKISRDPWSFILYALFYNALMAPACIHGYLSEVLHFKQKWGTK